MTNKMRTYLRARMEDRDDDRDGYQTRRDGARGESYTRRSDRDNMPYREGNTQNVAYIGYRGNRNEVYNESPMRRIGFSANGDFDDQDEIGYNYRSEYSYPRMDEMRSHTSGAYQIGMSEGHSIPKFTHAMAEEWVEKMIGENGKTADHIPIDRAKEMMQQISYKGDPYEFWAVMNAVHSDYGKVFAKYGLSNNMEFIAEMAKAWISDPDAVHNKASAYFMHIVK